MHGVEFLCNSTFFVYKMGTIIPTSQGIGGGNEVTGGVLSSWHDAQYSENKWLLSLFQGKGTEPDIQMWLKRPSACLLSGLSSRVSLADPKAPPPPAFHVSVLCIAESTTHRRQLAVKYLLERRNELGDG